MSVPFWWNERYEVPGSEIEAVTITKEVVEDDVSPVYSKGIAIAETDENEPLEEE